MNSYAGGRKLLQDGSGERGFRNNGGSSAAGGSAAGSSNNGVNNGGFRNGGFNNGGSSAAGGIAAGSNNGGFNRGGTESAAAAAAAAAAASQGKDASAVAAAAAAAGGSNSAAAAAAAAAAASGVPLHFYKHCISSEVAHAIVQDFHWSSTQSDWSSKGYPVCNCRQECLGRCCRGCSRCWTSLKVVVLARLYSELK